jgi:hypothetical protein
MKQSFCFTFFIFISAAATTLCGSWPPPLFPNSSFLRAEVVSLTTKPNVEEQGLHFLWPLTFDLSGMDGPTIIVLLLFFLVW